MTGPIRRGYWDERPIATPIFTTLRHLRRRVHTLFSSVSTTREARRKSGKEASETVLKMARRFRSNGGVAPLSARHADRPSISKHPWRERGNATPATLPSDGSPKWGVLTGYPVGFERTFSRSLSRKLISGGSVSRSAVSLKCFS